MYEIEAVLLTSFSAEAILQSNLLTAEAELNVTMIVQGGVATYIAGASLGGQRVVMVSLGKANYFDPTDENNTGKTLGITKHAAITDDTIMIVHQGKMKSSGWGLTPDAIYYAALDGTITDSIPTSGISQRIGVAVDADTMMVKFSEPIILI